MASSTPKEPWQSIAARKQADRLSKLPPSYRIPSSLLPPPTTTSVHNFPTTSALLTPRELHITNSTATAIVSALASGTYTATEVLHATLHRMTLAQDLLNCITELDIPSALLRAKDLDTYFTRSGGKTLGPLHGLPISLKDQFNLPGLDTTMGYISRCFAPATESSVLCNQLLAAGAILYVKTNVPATLMMGESVNNVFLRTLNPYNLTLTPGGSSGGEAALVAFGGSFLGVGTDIGGSIRHPCSFTGLWGLRPSHGRVSYAGVGNTFLGQEAVRSCAGPMARSPHDLRLFMRTVVGSRGLDPEALPIPWREEEEKLPEKSCFGIAVGDGYVNASPPLRRAVEITKQKLLAAGHSVMEFVPHENVPATDIICKMWSADSGTEFRRDTQSSGEPLHPQLQKWTTASRENPQTVFETWQNQHRRTDLARSWMERWEATSEETGTGRPMDGLIMPSTPFPAIRHEGGYPWHYGALSPLLDLTTGVFPVTKVDAVKDVVPGDWVAVSEKDGEVMGYYGGPENHANAPVGLALIARRLEEEKVVAMLSLISETVEIDY